MSEVVIGVDLGIRKIAYSQWRDGELEKVGAYSATESWTRMEQIFECADYLDAIVNDLVEVEMADVLVVIEEPLVGNNIKYSMQISQLYGACLSALASYYTAYPSRFGVQAARVGQWKKDVIGHGHASKEDIRNYMHVSHKGYAALCGDDQDQFDAACIGLYGLVLTARADAMRAPL